MNRRIVHGIETDAYGPWRHYLCYMQRPGMRKWVKRMTHKRERREGRQEARQRDNE